ncbi:Response regulator of zinc sigma-54-dependent two-component system [Desulfovibrio sp. DV]|uniref:sigma-54-dependent transcriptional regulator n=1 Tax=Desulfovibrio sp. DV TaxID=1844708 RepID=UPI00094B7D14|nr:sigma-54 dependent transcriptional regulator [Desulfovibrio sp. DV]OLN29781.1 Response regulator of zinc sigma-54-dependent two-component system [Desulfovibrio sp. DV]
MTGGAVLIVDDEAIAVENLSHILAREGYAVSAAASGEEALAILGEREFDLVLTDLRMKGIDGLAVLGESKRLWPDTEVVVMTGHATVATAVEAMRLGACHYLTKPYGLAEVRATVAEAMDKRRLRLEVARLSRQVAELGRTPLIIGESPAVQALKDNIHHIAPTDSTVLILGETGTGKELVARAIHESSLRNDRRFLAINCGAFNEDLLANELFGHEKGAFSGASTLKKGLLEVAGEGTLFLDEIGEMSLTMQVRLLRVLQERHFFRVGGTQEIPVAARLLAATNKDLKGDVERGLFRADLYYRLNVITLRVPPLSGRRQDIPLLAGYFIAKYAAAMGKKLSGFSAEAVRRLMAYEYPGNIRELENIVQRTVIMAKGDVIEAGDLPQDLSGDAPLLVKHEAPPLVTLEELERRHIRDVLAACDGNKTRAAEILGIDRVSLWRKAKRLGLDEA